MEPQILPPHNNLFWSKCLRSLMGVQRVGKHFDISSLLETGFQPLSENKKILQYSYTSQQGTPVRWYWIDSDYQLEPTEDFNGILIKLRKVHDLLEIEVLSDSVEISFHQNFILSNRLLDSLALYFQIFKKPLNSEMIDEIFGRDSFFYQLAMNSLQIDNREMIQWRNIYKKLYDERILDERLYLSHKYFLLLLRLFTFNLWEKPDFSRAIFEEIIDLYPTIRISRDTFTSLFSKTIYSSKVLSIFQNLLPKLEFQANELFSTIFQSLISLETRHPLGEVYTPTLLIQKMLTQKVSNQTSYLDPSCGTGMFLVEITSYLLAKNQLDATKQILGIDINPLSIEAALANFIILLKNIDSIHHPEVYLVNSDALLLDYDQENPVEEPILTSMKTNKVDFIIGNPPWINISGIYQRNYKEQLKSLAREMHILFNAESKNTEICTIFFNRTKDEFLKENGELFFVLPASVLNGRQHGYFRYFPGCHDIEVWRFTKDIFKVHSICLYVKKDGSDDYSQNRESDKDRLTLLGRWFKVSKNGKFVELSEKDKLIPIYIKREKSNRFPLVGRYNSISSVPTQLKNISPEKSPYYAKVRGGLRLVPRRWVVIKEHPPFKESVMIHPDLNQQTKPLWSTPPYTEFEIESEYIHAFVKSQFLIPFTFTKIQYVFIPLYTSEKVVKRGKVINNSTLKSKAAALYQLLDSEYRKHIKPSASMKTLADNFTYNNRLLPTEVLMKPHQVMVVHNSIGSIVKSAIIREPILLDNSLYYIFFDNLEEAYYLCGILNSNVMTDLVKLIGSTGSRGSLRNIHKNPYNFLIPIFSATSVQLEIVQISKELEKFVHQFVFTKFNSLDSKLTNIVTTNRFKKGSRSIQKMILTDPKYITLRTRLDKLVRIILDPEILYS
jgi:tRNA1(Val) A37 N6-methylase TrmN6